MKQKETSEKSGPAFLKVRTKNEFPDWASKSELVSFLHHTMKPFNDSMIDIQRALELALDESGKGFVMLLKYQEKLGGALVMLETGMKGFIPENLLLFVSVSPDLRGLGLGKKLIERSLQECKGEVKLHVEYENPAKRLYERIGFTSKYAEMRYTV